MSINNMKTLHQHISQVKTLHSLNEFISEKLVINKNFKKTNLYISEPCHNEGRCIYLAIPSKKNDSNNRVSISEGLRTYCVETEKGIKKIYYKNPYGDNVEIEKNEYGFYIANFTNEFWCHFILFEEAAIEFLENLLTDVEQKIDVSDYKFNNEKHVKTGIYQCIDDNKEFCDKNKIIEMINELKENI